MKRKLVIFVIVALLLQIYAAFQPQTKVFGEEGRTGTIIESGGSPTAQQLAEAILEPTTLGLLASASKGGASIQFEVYTLPTTLQGFPTSESSFAVISSGKASGIAGTAYTFFNHIVGGLTSPPKSHRDYNSFDIAYLSLQLNIPSYATTLSFDWRFGTEENPSFTSWYRDWARANVITPTGAVNILLLPDNNPVDGYYASSFSNEPGGSSIWPSSPYPDPNDCVFNAVTQQMYTSTFDVTPYAGSTITIEFWIGDESDPGLDSALFIDNLAVTPIVMPVTIDIKPGSDPNSICLNDSGLLPVAILGAADFDVTTTNVSTIELGGADLATRGSKKAPKLAYSFEDVNEDGYMDLMTFFKVQMLVDAGALTDMTTELALTAKLYDATPILGADSVRVVPP